MADPLQVNNPALHNAIVNFTLDWFSKNEVGPEGNRLQIALAERFPDAKGRDVELALLDVGQRLDERQQVRDAVYTAEIEFNEKIMAMYEGLPDDTVLGDAVRIRAAEGNEFALYLQANPHLLEFEIEIEGDANG